MNLKILSLSEALKYDPTEKSGAIRILDEFGGLISNLKESDNWIGINEYYFEDKWPKEWKEYSWYDTKSEEFQNYLKSQQEEHSKMTEESLIEYFESRGHLYGRGTLFDKNFARKIYLDFEKIRDEIETLVVHCTYGKNRAPSVGIAMNEIYGWGIVGLKEEFPSYRRYVYQTMIDVGKEFR